MGKIGSLRYTTDDNDLPQNSGTDWFFDVFTDPPKKIPDN